MKTRSITRRFLLFFLVSFSISAACEQSNAQVIIPTNCTVTLPLPACANGPCPLLKTTSQCDVILPYAPYAKWGVVGGKRRLVTNGIPDHAVGVFPINDVGAACPCGRPDGILEQNPYIIYDVPLSPGQVSQIGVRWLYLPEEFGMAKNGVEFEATADEWYNNDCTTGWEKNALQHPDMAGDLDCNNGHVQPGGIYHYHGMPTRLYEQEGGTYPWNPLDGLPVPVLPSSAKTVRLGYAQDGRPVYGPTCYRTGGVLPDWWKPKSSWVLRTSPTGNRGMGNPPGNYNGYYDQDYNYIASAGDLDKCNGHIEWTPDYPNPVYHYHITIEFPYIPRCLRKPWQPGEQFRPEQYHGNNQ